MKQERSFGIIPLTLRSRGWDVFLVRHLKGNYWGFPKGHREKGESPKEAAERELLEETGMKVLSYLPCPYLIDTYHYKTPRGELVAKQVQLYLAKVTLSYQLQAEELIEGKWIALEELFSYISFESQRALYLSLLAKLENIKDD